MSKRVTSLKQAIDLSLKNRATGEIDAAFSIKVEGENWQCYTASIAHRDILLYCDKGTATFLVDSYGGRNVAELFDWEKETENE